MVENDDADFDSMLLDCAQDLDTKIVSQTPSVAQSIETNDDAPKPIAPAPQMHV